MPENSESLEPFADISLDEMSVKLIDYLRKEFGSKSVDYLEPLTRLTGGYETLICRFQVSGVDERLSNPLIIRVYAENSHPSQPLKEKTVQNTLADLGYPVPAVHCTCTDKTILGSAFSIMEFSEGKTLLDSNTPFDQMFDILGDLHARVHKVDPEPIVSGFSEVGWDKESINFDGRLEWFRTTVNIYFPWLNESVEWLIENHPNDPESLSVCHCDFHPLNILFKDGKVKAILDWGAFMIGDSAMDVAYTIHTAIPAKLIYPDIDPAQFPARYLDAYRRTRPLDETNMAYYLTFRNLMALTEGTKGHVLLGHPEVVKMLLTSIYEISGVNIKMPE
jgi:aminoglycoside phosphotransferase (APT) family kinase protein